MKYLMFLIIVISQTIVAQNVKEIISFECKPVDTDWERVILSKVLLLENDSISYESDTILIHFIYDSNHFSYSRYYRNGWYTYTRCYNYKDKQKCNSDSAYLYTPVNSLFRDRANDALDTARVYDYSYCLTKLNKEVLSELKYSKTNIIRLLKINSYTTEIYTISGDVGALVLQIEYFDNSHDFKNILKVERLISDKEYTKVFNLFMKSQAKDRSKRYSYAETTGFVIETFVDGQYQFKNENFYEIEKRDKHLLKLYKILKKNITPVSDVL